jgi:hypothetical protein
MKTKVFNNKLELSASQMPSPVEIRCLVVVDLAVVKLKEMYVINAHECFI